MGLARGTIVISDADGVCDIFSGRISIMSLYRLVFTIHTVRVIVM